jgi:hypothetical protein
VHADQIVAVGCVQLRRLRFGRRGGSGGHM